MCDGLGPRAQRNAIVVLQQSPRHTRGVPCTQTPARGKILMQLIIKQWWPSITPKQFNERQEGVLENIKACKFSARGYTLIYLPIQKPVRYNMDRK